MQRPPDCVLCLQAWAGMPSLPPLLGVTRLRLVHVSVWQLDMRKRIKGNVLRGGDDERGP